MRKINKIIIHSSATPEGREHDANDIRNWHVKGNGWSDIGYHFVIKLDGTVEKGREVASIGSHCQGQNQGSIGVCYIGGMDVKGKEPKDTRTDAQKKSLVDLIKSLKTVYGGRVTVHGHSEFSTKACPCFNVKEEYSSFNKK